MGRLETAGPVLDGPGERTVHVPKQLALQQALAQRPAVDPHEGAGGPVAEMVNRRRDQFLARSRFAQQQDGGVAAGHAPRGPIHFFHRRA